MPKVRVLVVDDSVVVRRMVSDILGADPRIEVCGVAANGRIALQKIAQLNPDLVTLDIEMPELDGLETLTELRKTGRRLPVIMFSTLTERGAEATFTALSRGATDYVTKPTNSGSIALAKASVQLALIPKILAACGREGVARGGLQALRDQLTPAALVGTPRAPQPVPQPAPRPAPPRHRPPVELVVIGVSTGGPTALAVLVPSLPADLPVPVVIVQHMPPMFTNLLARRLDESSKLRVREGFDLAPLKAGEIWIAPGDHHLVVKKQGAGFVLGVQQGPPENSCRPAADVLFRSAAELFGAKTLGVVLTGMGQDGLRGAELIVRAGGQILAQDEATSVVWGMPGFVAQAKLADAVLPISAIGAEIRKRVAVGRSFDGRTLDRSLR